MSDILERLEGYNPPDRTIDSQRQIAIDIWDAVKEIQDLRKRLAEAERELKELRGEVLIRRAAAEANQDIRSRLLTRLDEAERERDNLEQCYTLVQEERSSLEAENASLKQTIDKAKDWVNHAKTLPYAVLTDLYEILCEVK